MATPNLALLTSTVGVQTDPGWSQNHETNWNLLDVHDHSAGKGVKVTPAGLNINQDLTFAGFNATNVRATRFANQSVNLTPGGAEVGEIYLYNGDLWFINSGAVAIQLTVGSAINVSSAGQITGMGGTTATAVYNNISKSFVWSQAANQSAKLDAGAVTIRDNATVGSNGVTIAAPAGGPGSSYTMTLPSALPGNSELLWITSGGQLGFGGSVVSTSGVTFNGAVTLAAATTVSGVATFNAQPISTVGSAFPSTALASVTTPAAGSLALYQDSLTGKFHGKNSSGNSYPLYMQVPNTAQVIAFNTTESVVAGGVTSGGNAPAFNFKLPAAGLVVGATLRVRIFGTCTSSVGNNTTVRVRIGANGTTADGVALASGSVVAGTTGTGIAFFIDIIANVTAIGASATFSSTTSQCMVTSGQAGAGILGGSLVASASGMTATAFNSTAAFFASATLVSSGTTTTYTVTTATAEWL